MNMKKVEHSKRYYAMRHERTLYFHSYSELYKHLTNRPRMRVRVYDIDEAEALMGDLMARGYEGVQNDSYRYCKESANRTLKSGCCYICNGGGAIYVANGHDPKRKKFLDVSKSKFISVLDSI